MPVTGDQIRDSLRAVPFKPFRLHLADQRTVEVVHPDFAMVSPNGPAISTATSYPALILQPVPRHEPGARVNHPILAPMSIARSHLSIRILFCRHARM